MSSRKRRSSRAQCSHTLLSHVANGGCPPRNIRAPFLLAPMISPPDGSAASLFGGHMKKAMWSVACVLALAGATGCAQTAKGVVQDTKENTSAVRGGVETVDVKTAIIADKNIDSGAI